MNFISNRQDCIKTTLTDSGELNAAFYVLPFWQVLWSIPQEIQTKTRNTFTINNLLGVISWCSQVTYNIAKSRIQKKVFYGLRVCRDDYNHKYFSVKHINRHYKGNKCFCVSIYSAYIETHVTKIAYHFMSGFATKCKKIT